MSEKVEYYFAIIPDELERPFVFGAQSFDSSLPSTAQWGASSRFGLKNIEAIDGEQWKDWRRSLEMVGCLWVIPIIEEAISKDNITCAVSEIIQRYPKS